MPIAIAIHHPVPEHHDDWVALMRQASQQVSFPGLIEITGYQEAEGGRLVAVSRWETPEAMRAGVAEMWKLADQTDKQWGAEATKLLILDEI